MPSPLSLELGAGGGLSHLTDEETENWSGPGLCSGSLSLSEEIRDSRRDLLAPVPAFPEEDGERTGGETALSTGWRM